MTGSEAVDAGDDFARLLVQYDRAIFRYILMFISRHDDAEEILQRVATVLWKKFSEYDRSRNFLPWAQRMAYFEVLKFRAEVARSRLIFCEEVMESLADTRESQNPILEAQKQALQECLKKVGADAVVLLKRRYCEAEKATTLAAESGKTVKSFYRRLDRLRNLIADCIDRRIRTTGAASST